MNTEFQHTCERSMMHSFKIGDMVNYVNGMGVNMGVRKIAAYALWDDVPRYYYEGTDTPWYPVYQHQLSLVTGTPEPVQHVCGNCGSSMVYYDATAYWDVDTQSFALSDGSERGPSICGGDCGDEGTVTIKPVIEETFTFWIAQANGEGTHYVTAVTSHRLGSAKIEALNDCAEDWQCEADTLHILGVAKGDIEILEWDEVAA